MHDRRWACSCVCDMIGELKQVAPLLPRPATGLDAVRTFNRYELKYVADRRLARNELRHPLDLLDDDVVGDVGLIAPEQPAWQEPSRAVGEADQRQQRDANDSRSKADNPALGPRARRGRGSRLTSVFYDQSSGSG